MDENRVPVATLENLGCVFTEQTTEVWCDWAETYANTNFDGQTHFCQFCGSTEHKAV